VSEGPEGTRRIPFGVEPAEEALPPLQTIAPESPDEPDVAESELAESELAESEVPESELAEPEVPESELAEPELAEPEVAEPEVEVAEPEVVEPDAAEPEVLPQAVEDAAAPEHAEGELRLPDGVVVHEGSADGGPRSVGIVVSRFNGEITNLLLDGAMAVLDEAGVERERVELMPVPGAFELPLGAMALARTRRFACVVALGCVIRGETPHFDFICNEAASGLQLAGLETGVPVAFGVLTCETREQAAARAGGDRGNKGAEAARSALEMADVFARLRTPA
jgi:6,7-dimethyl-8-ribityllumazine synthase